MNTLRVTANIVLSGVLTAASIYLLSVHSYALHGMHFVGRSRYLLSVSLFCMAIFAGVIAQGWIRGTLSKPPPSSFTFDLIYVDPGYKGEMLVRCWYILMPALFCIILAFTLAEDGAA